MGEQVGDRTAADTRPAEWAARQHWTSDRFAELEPLSGSRRRMAEDAIVLRHLDLVDGLVRRLASGYRDQSDLRQVGCIGLLNAVRRFDRDRGDNFISFAVPTISGEIKRYLRDNGWFIRPPRRMQELRLAVSTATAELAQTLHREPTVADLAGYLEAAPETVAEAVGTRTSLHPVSLDAGQTDDDTPLGASIGVVDERLERADLRLSLRIALQCLTARERRVVYLRFIEERTQVEIAEEIGVTQMQVSRILAQILRRLQEHLDDLGDAGRGTRTDAAAIPQAERRSA
ncbi:sigma-70 family RNA polymerase sigma factor [Agromyces salentinus]|uniref:SigB/SigF/SigG family RNA polymerase sigma factor n=1 Tax=Agromyces salentinus TaxID=269421 RepID=A0ABN2MZX5_9MICO|nr:sigma-70 family RNA polymerase sigma factor [Agromyces salentinus]